MAAEPRFSSSFRGYSIEEVDEAIAVLEHKISRLETEAQAVRFDTQTREELIGERDAAIAESASMRAKIEKEPLPEPDELRLNLDNLRREYTTKIAALENLMAAIAGSAGWSDPQSTAEDRGEQYWSDEAQITDPFLSPDEPEPLTQPMDKPEDDAHPKKKFRWLHRHDDSRDPSETVDFGELQPMADEEPNAVSDEEPNAVSDVEPNAVSDEEPNRHSEEPPDSGPRIRGEWTSRSPEEPGDGSAGPKGPVDWPEED